MVAERVTCPLPEEVVEVVTCPLAGEEVVMAEVVKCPLVEGEVVVDLIAIWFAPVVMAVVVYVGETDWMGRGVKK